MAFSNIDPQKLLRITEYVDPSTGWIVVNTPVLADGERDPVRQETFFGRSILTGAGGQSIPVEFPIKDATTLAEALQKWLACLTAQVDEINSKAIQNRIMSSAGPPSKLSAVPKGNGRT